MLGNHETHSSCGQEIVTIPIGRACVTLIPLIIDHTPAKISLESKGQLLTDVGRFVSHHVFVVVDSTIGNVRLVSNRKNVELLNSRKQIMKLFILTQGWFRNLITKK